MSTTQRVAIWLATAQAVGFWVIAFFANPDTAPYALGLAGFHMIIAVMLSTKGDHHA